MMNGRITHGLPSDRPEGCWQTGLGWLALGLGLGVGLLGRPAIAQTPPSEAPTTQTERSPQRPTLQLGSQGAAVAQVQAMLTLLGYYTGPVDGQYQDSTAIAVATFQQAAGLMVDGVMGPNTWAALLPAPDGQPVAAEPVPAEPTETPTPAVPFPSPTPSPETSPSESAAPSEATSSAETASEEAIAPSPADPSPTDLPVLRMGMQGSAVERLQERLRVLGVYSAPIDGIFGPATQAAVQDIQRRNRLDPDGIVGPATWTVLFRATD
ncbi:MAG: peptidoglycan-binding protein [Leptolyngbya sp. DLM2.Bin15]|nr:MAG: peptidoglycan-binding protein [Leptolyngbya sp. DLM2.Bin15]